MSGVRGRSGALARSAEEHVMRGTFRADRHGERPGPRSVDVPPGPPTVTRPSEDAPHTSARPRSPRAPATPRHLRPATRRWFRYVVTTWTLEQHHVRLLQLACEAWDLYQAAREGIAKGGLTVKSSRGGPRLNPLLRVEDTHRRAFQRLIAQLDLEDVAMPGGRR